MCPCVHVLETGAVYDGVIRPCGSTPTSGLLPVWAWLPLRLQHLCAQALPWDHLARRSRPMQCRALAFSVQCPQTLETDMYPAWWDMPLMPESGGEGRMMLFQDSLLHTEFQANLSYKVRLSYKNYPHRSNWARAFSSSSTKQTKTKASLWWRNWDTRPGAHTGKTSSLFKFCLFVSDLVGYRTVIHHDKINVAT